MLKSTFFLFAMLFTQTLILRSAAVSNESQKAFFAACTQANYKKIKTIFNFFAHDHQALSTLVNNQDENGNTPLLLVLMECHKELTTLITDLYAHNRSSEEIETTNEQIEQLKAFDHKRLKICLLILEAKPNLNIKNHQQETVLLYGIKNHTLSLELADHLLNAGADPKIKDLSGNNALDYTLHLFGFSYNSDKLLKLLLSKINRLTQTEVLQALNIISALHNTIMPYLPPLKRDELLNQMEHFSLVITKKALPHNAEYMMTSGYRILYKK